MLCTFPKERRNAAPGVFRTTLFVALSLTLAAFTPAIAQKPSAFNVVAPRVGPAVPSAMVTTHHNDNQRTGANPNETAFIPTGVGANVNANSFGKIWSRSLDGTVYAQPLFVPAVSCPQAPDLLTNVPNTGVYNLVFVCTTHNSIYAFDGGGSAQIKNPASTSKAIRVAPIWKISFNFPNSGIGPVPLVDVQSDDLTPEIGIIGTPVIDCQTDPVTGYKKGTLYVVVKTREDNTASFAQRLHAIDIGTGQERIDMGSPRLIQASVPGSGDGSIFDAQGNQVVPFDPLTENQQAALTLVNAGTPSATIYVAWGSHGNVTPYHGWVMSFKASNLQLIGAYNTSPNGDSSTSNFPAGAGIWQAGAGPSVDESGNLYVSTGVGIFNGDPVNFSGGTEFGNSVLKLQIMPNVGGSARPGPSGSGGAGNTFNAVKHTLSAPDVLDYFTPFNWQDLSDSGNDLGSGGVVILPDVGASAPRIAVAAGVEGTIYVLNRDNMGQFNGGSSTTPFTDAVVQELPAAVGSIYGDPAFLSSTSTLYYQGAGDVLKAFQFIGGNLTQVGQSFRRFDFPGATPVISSNPGGSNAIVWTVEWMNRPPIIMDPNYNIPAPAPLAILHAYDANNVATELFSGSTGGLRDFAGTPALYTPPTVANGRVYVGAANMLTAFGNFAANGVTAGPIQADHFLVTGPVSSDFNAPFISQKVGAWYSITAVGPDGNPIKLNSTVHLSYRNYSTNSLTSIGSLNFNDPINGPQSNVVVNYAFRDPGTYDLYVVDDYGHSSLVDNFDLAPLSFTYPAIGVLGFASASLDHYVLKAPTQAKVGSRVAISISAVTANNTPAPILVTFPGVINCYDTLPNGVQGADAFAPGYAYDNAQPSALFFKFTNGVQGPSATSTIQVTIRGLGNHVFVVSDGVDTGTCVIKGIP